MKLALIGYPVTHSLSPKIYKELLGSQIEYDLLEIADVKLLPTLEELAKLYSGFNITTPYKTSYFSKVTVTDPLIKKLGAINTVSLSLDGYFATNTDLVAVRTILKKKKENHPQLHISLLGNGVMARITLLVAQELNIRVKQFARSLGHNLGELDLNNSTQGTQLIINSCSRQYVFEGKLNKNSQFWDYNYNFPSHSQSIPSLVKHYEDGQEMLKVQAQAAIEFWKITNPKLKY